MAGFSAQWVLITTMNTGIPYFNNTIRSHDRRDHGMYPLTHGLRCDRASHHTRLSRGRKYFKGVLDAASTVVCHSGVHLGGRVFTALNLNGNPIHPSVILPSIGRRSASIRLALIELRCYYFKEMLDIASTMICLLWVVTNTQDV